MQKNKVEFGNFIYFIEAFKKGKQIIIKYKEITLDPFIIKEIKDNEIVYILNIYRFDKKLINFADINDKNIKIKISLDDKEDGNFESIISKEIIPLGNDFLFNLEFKRPTFFTYKLPSGQYYLSNKRQYEIFKSLLYLEDESQINDLIISAKNMLSNAEKYEFSFFVDIFSDINLIRDLLDYTQIFSIKKICSLGYIDNKKLIIAKSLVNSNFNNIEKYIVSKEKIIRDKLLTKMGIFLFYFNYQYQKEKIINLLNNNSFNIYIYQILIEKENIFENFSLPKICVNKLITFTKNFEELLIIISYEKDILETLEIINENNTIIFEKLKESEKESENEKEKGKRETKINLKKENIKESDNMEKIKIQIEKLLSFEKEAKINIVYFSRKFLEIYIEKYNEKNINDLIILNEVIKLIMEHENKKIYNSLLKLDHQKLLKYANEVKMKNLDLLNFIKKDEFLFKNNDDEKHEILSLDIFNGIDIHMINDEFLKIWKEIKWLELFKNSEKDFYLKISNLIKHLKYFGKLFSLFDIYDEEKDYDDSCLIIMKDKFINLLDDPKEESPNFIEDISNLIYFLNVKNISIKSFLNEYLLNIIEKEKIHKILYKIYSNDEYKVFHDELKNIIFEFYKNEKKFKNPLYLGFYIQNNEVLNEEELSEINNYIFEPDEFYNYEENDKFKLLKKIIESNSIDKKELVNYIQLTKAISSMIIEEIINGIVGFTNIDKFYFNGKEKELFERIRLISCLLDNKNLIKNSSLCREIIEKNINNLHQIINDLEIIQKKLQVFYPNYRKEDIKKISDILKNIRKKELFYYKNEEVEKKINYYIKQKDLNRLNLNLEKGNIFFKLIYLENKQLYKDNDFLIMQETEKTINILINALKSNSLRNININNICSLLTKLSKEEINNIEKEIDKLSEQYEIDIIANKNKLIEELKLIYKKNTIYDTVKYFLSFIEMTEVEQEDFTQINKIIIKYLQNPTDVNIIKFSLDLLKNYGIEFKDDTNYKFLRIFDIFKNRKDIFDFLLNITLKKCQDFLDYFDKNKLVKDNIPNLVECKHFFDKIINKNKKDKDIIKSFICGISEFESIEENFKKLINSFDIISDLIPILEE